MIVKICLLVLAVNFASANALPLSQENQDELSVLLEKLAESTACTTPPSIAATDEEVKENPRLATRNLIWSSTRAKSYFTDLALRYLLGYSSDNPNPASRAIIAAPTKCPKGQQKDYTGICRDPL